MATYAPIKPETFEWAFDLMDDRLRWEDAVFGRDIKTGEILSEDETLNRFWCEFTGICNWIEVENYSNFERWGCDNPRLDLKPRELLIFGDDREIALERLMISMDAYNSGRGVIRTNGLEEDEDSTTLSTKLEPAMVCVQKRTGDKIPNHTPKPLGAMEQTEMDLYHSRAFDCALQKLHWPNRVILKFNSVPLRPDLLRGHQSPRQSVQNRMTINVYEDAAEVDNCQYIYKDGVAFTACHQWMVKDSYLWYQQQKQLRDKVKSHIRSMDSTNLSDGVRRLLGDVNEHYTD